MLCLRYILPVLLGSLLVGCGGQSPVRYAPASSPTPSPDQPKLSLNTQSVDKHRNSYVIVTGRGFTPITQVRLFGHAIAGRAGANQFTFSLGGFAITDPTGSFSMAYSAGDMLDPGTFNLWAADDQGHYAPFVPLEVTP
jgi:hypothetical protein